MASFTQDIKDFRREAYAALVTAMMTLHAEDIDMEHELDMVDAAARDAETALARTIGLLQDMPRQLLSAEQMQSWTEETDYSEKYCDDVYEYRRVTVPRGMLQIFPQGRVMMEAEWRGYGITMSRGWQHYDFHTPETNVLLFRRVLGTDPRTGDIPVEMQAKVDARHKYIAELEQMRQRLLNEKQRRREYPDMDLL
eukprot:TRINITY_DN44090_c0_g1_i1.p1 TRINITY_DN44090_c0_g1~~TRINITY_DN44090_c0_g1_i1.p1  ORF type:complete len:196 (+),score=40.84 TRINITY_DN44090_c0_g1_i1:18-605(+)